MEAVQSLGRASHRMSVVRVYSYFSFRGVLAPINEILRSERLEACGSFWRYYRALVYRSGLHGDNAALCPEEALHVLRISNCLKE
ncbi:hypothetical protein D3C73_1197440 [compost metagenome]